MFTIQDAISKIQTGAQEENWIEVVYQIGRLFRRIFEFQPMTGNPLKASRLTHCEEEEIELKFDYSSALSKSIMMAVGFADGAFSNY